MIKNADVEDRLKVAFLGLISLLFPGQPVDEVIGTLIKEGFRVIRKAHSVNSEEGASASEGSGPVSEGQTEPIS